MAQTIFAVHCRTVRSGSKLGHTDHTGQYGSISQFPFFTGTVMIILTPTIQMTLLSHHGKIWVESWVTVNMPSSGKMAKGLGDTNLLS